MCVCLRQPLCRRHCRVCLFFRLSKYDFLKTTCVFCKKEEGKRSFLKIVAGNRMSRSVLDSFCPAHSCVSCLACYLFFLLQLHKGNYYCSVFRIYPFCGRRRMLSVMLRESSNSLSLSISSTPESNPSKKSSLLFTRFLSNLTLGNTLPVFVQSSLELV